MKLRYRGTSYQAQSSQTETLISNQTVRFLGQIYLRRCSLLQSKSKLGTKKYRGVVYGS